MLIYRGGKKRDWLDTSTGQVVSRRQHDKMIAEAMATKQYQGYAQLALDQGVTPAEFKRAVFAVQLDRENKSAKGPLAQLLVMIGYRSEDDTWDVGRTR